MPPLPRHSAYFDLALVEPRGGGEFPYLRITRTPLRYPDVATIEADFRSNIELVRPYGHLAALVDMRAGPVPSSDTAIEQAIARSGRDLSARFLRVALLVKSAVGSLQVKRVSRDVGMTTNVFTSEAEALAFLREA